jgi:lysozyme family protein
MLTDAFRIVNVDLEGGSRMTDDPLDPGGLTKWGFSQRANPDIDIANLDEAKARDLAFQRYWKPMMCDQFSPGVGLAVYDTAFNHGVGAATKMLQYAAGVRVDGSIGAITIRAVRMLDAGTLLIRLNERRMITYTIGTNAATLERFARGWMNRLIRITVEAMRLEARKTWQGPE